MEALAEQDRAEKEEQKEAAEILEESEKEKEKSEEEKESKHEMMEDQSETEVFLGRWKKSFHSDLINNDDWRPKKR
eukprot:1846742-Karenia_brevis.AAC.1